MSYRDGWALSENRMMPMTTMGYANAALIEINSLFGSSVVSFIIRSEPIFVSGNSGAVSLTKQQQQQNQQQRRLSAVHQSQLFDMFLKLGNKRPISIIEKLKCTQSVRYIHQYMASSRTGTPNCAVIVGAVWAIPYILVNLWTYSQHFRIDQLQPIGMVSMGFHCKLNSLDLHVDVVRHNCCMLKLTFN